MRSFRAAHAAARWPHPGPRTHVYIPVRAHHHTVHDLAARTREALSPWTERGVLAPVAPQWMHLTLAMVTGGTSDRDVLADTLTAHLADVPAIDVRVGSPLVGDSSVLLDIDDTDGALDALHHTVAEALADVGADTSGHDPRPHHITAAYGTGATDSGPIASRVRRAVRPAHAVMHVDEVVLVDVVQTIGPAELTYTWTEHTVIPLR